MKQIMNQGYLREYLEDKVSRNAYELYKAKSAKSRSQLTKSSIIRKDSISRNILQKRIEDQLEALRTMKGERNDVSFSSINRQHHQVRRDFKLPLLNHSHNRASDDSLSTSHQHRHGSGSTVDVSVPSSSLYRNRSIARNQKDILEDIKRIRARINEARYETESRQPMTKAEREQQLSDYFQAKKQFPK